MRHNKSSLIISAAIVSSLATATAEAAQPKNLFEVLFPKLKEQRLEREAERRRALQPAVEVVKVSAPKTYTYRVDKSEVIKLPVVAIAPADNDANDVPETTGSVAAAVDEPVAQTAESGGAGEAPTSEQAEQVANDAAVVIATSGAAVESAAGSQSVESEAATTSMSGQEFSAFEKDIALGGEVRVLTVDEQARAISKHYAEKPEYMWLNRDGEPNARARSALKVLSEAKRYGLRAEDYRVAYAAGDASLTPSGQAAARLEFELSMSRAVLRYAMDARYGRVNPNRLSGYHDFPGREGKSETVWTELTSGALPANLLPGFHPSNKRFAALMAELAGLSGQEDDSIKLDPDLLLKPGAEDERLASVIEAIRKRGSEKLLAEHAETFAAYKGDPVYTPGLVALVKSYQRQAGLGADGIVGRQTIGKLMGLGPHARIERVVLAMERLRWLPHEFGKRHVFINQPAYEATYLVDDKSQISMRAIVGKPSNQTSFFYDEIETVVYNPYWGVPRSIIVNEMLPKLRANPGYLDERGYELTNSKGQRVASSSVDWSQVGSNPRYDVRQPPGAKNALGELKILFPNKHAIYMHDTPSRHLFKQSKRALSHGCVRLQDPRGMAAAVLGKSKDYVGSKISAGHGQESVSQKIPVYVSYFTAWPNDNGAVGYFPDIYGRDRNLSKALSATEKSRDEMASS